MAGDGSYMAPSTMANSQGPAQDEFRLFLNKDGSLAPCPIIKLQGKKRWYGRVQPDGSVSLLSPEGAIDVGLDCDRSHICRLKFIWGRVWWRLPPFDPPSAEICVKDHHYKYRGPRSCQLCNEKHCCEPLESLRVCPGMRGYLERFLRIPSTMSLTGKLAGKGAVMSDVLVKWFQAGQRRTVDRRLLLRTWPQESLWTDLRNSLDINDKELRKLWNKAWNHGLPQWQSDVLSNLEKSTDLAIVEPGRVALSPFVAGTNNEVYLFRDCELQDSIMEVDRDVEVDYAIWRAKNLTPVKMMPEDGSWVRVQLDPGDENPRLSCAAQVYRRYQSSRKKATLIFWDEQRKRTHQVYDCDKAEIFMDSLQME